VAAALALALAGCSGETDEGPSSDATDAGALPPGDELPAVGGEEDAPVLEWPDTGPPEGLQVEVLSEGDGDEVGEGAAVLADYAGYVWGSDTAFDDSYSRGAPTMFSLNSVIPGWTDGIPGAPVGSRLLISVPPDLGYGPNGGNQQAGIGADDTIVFVVDVEAAYGADQTGQPDAAPTGEDLPVQVQGELGEPAAVVVPDGAEEPAEAAVYAVADGDGDVVEPGASIAVAYSVAFWDGSGEESSWDPEGQAPGPLVTTVGQGSIFDLLDGVTVGSRVVLTAPPGESGPAIAVVADVLGQA
jgi:peptidylprolyl isomerase